MRGDDDVAEVRLKCGDQLWCQRNLGHQDDHAVAALQFGRCQAHVELGLARAGDAVQQVTSTGYLLHGITGSGKTELYVRLAAAELKRGNSVIILVPEITLTPQLIATFESHFGDIVIATHSKLTEAERHK